MKGQKGNNNIIIISIVLFVAFTLLVPLHPHRYVEHDVCNLTVLSETQSLDPLGVPALIQYLTTLI